MKSPFLIKAEVGLTGAKALLEIGDTDGVCSRSYYAMYNAALALLQWADVSPDHGAFKTHHGVIAAFGLHIVKPGHFPVETGRALQRVQSLRQIADYETVPVPRDKAVDALEAAVAFVAVAASTILQPYKRLHPQ